MFFTNFGFHFADQQLMKKEEFGKTSLPGLGDVYLVPEVALDELLEAYVLNQALGTPPREELTLGYFIRHYRNSLDVGRTAFAAQLTLDKSHIPLLENNSVKVNTNTLTKLKRALGTKFEIALKVLGMDT